MTDQDEWRLGFFILTFLIGCGLGHELWKINATLERIADTLKAMSEKREEEEL